MAATKAAADASATTKVDLIRLIQSQVAFLIGKPAKWVRDNAHLFLRDDDGRYDARGVVNAMVELANKIAEPAHISDEHYGPIFGFLRNAANDAGRIPGLVRVVREVEAEHGLAGHAAIGVMLKEQIGECLDGFPRGSTEEQIRADHAERLTRALEALPYEKAAIDWRVVATCDKHKRYLWGRSWKSYPLPPGYFPDEERDYCDVCEREDRKRTKAN